MKKLLLISALLLSSLANATSMHPDTMKAIQCKKAAGEVAKLNMDQKARAYTLDESAVDEAVFEQSIQGQDEKLYKFNVAAFIYRANYNVEVVLDSSCGVDSVKIKELLPEYQGDSKEELESSSK